jgi:hypothetical protein
VRASPDRTSNDREQIFIAENKSTQSVMAVGRGAEQSEERPSTPGPEHSRLDVFIGKWILQGKTTAGEGAPSLAIRTSDTYEWMPGGFFVLHLAYGLIGNIPPGGTEIIGYEVGEEKYRSQFFDSQGNITTHELALEDGNWTWQGESTRCTVAFSEDGTTQTAHHERSNDGANWEPSMEVTVMKAQ